MKTLEMLILAMNEASKREARCQAIAHSILALENRAKTATGEELEKIKEAIEQGKKLLEAT